MLRCLALTATLMSRAALAQAAGEATGSAPDGGISSSSAPITVAPEPLPPAPGETLLQRLALTVGMFGNFDGAVSSGEVPGFAIGQVDLFVTSRPLPSLSLLAEVVFEAGTDHAFVVDVERLMASWLFDPRLRVTVGRVHQALGYYNAAFHHGTLLMNTVARPAALAFEDAGGVLPVHAIGVEVAGDWELGDLSLGYNLTVANGRGRNPDEILNVKDLNPTKSVLGALTLTHLGWGARLGINALYDRIPVQTDGTGVQLRPAQDEVILGAHVLLDRSPVWFLAEGYLIDHTSSLGLRRSLGFFAEGRISIRPAYLYARFDLVSHPAEIDPFFDPQAPVSSTRSVLMGVGWKVVSALVVKLEGELAFPAAGVVLPTARAQVAWSL